MYQQEWIRKLNNHGNSVGASRFLIEIDSQDMLKKAKEVTGLSDFGDGNWQENYNYYIDKLNDIDQLHTLGRIRIKTALLIALRNRLLITEKIKQQPMVQAEKIHKPLFITGLPRTGTTILYSLLGLDPIFRAPLGYEVVAPIYRAMDVVGDITRSDMAECVFDFEMDINSKVKTMHNRCQSLPVECQNIMTNVLAQFYSDTIGDDNSSQTRDYSIPDYSWHKKVLQVLQYDGINRTWLLKCPSHISAMEKLIEVYPTSRIIHTHRNPVPAISSCAQYLKYLTDSHCKSDNFDKTLKTLITTLEKGLRKTIAQRNSSLIKSSSIHDVHFDQLLKDPISSIEGIYGYFDIPFNDRKRERILAYLDTNKRYSKGRYSCNLETFGLSKKNILRQFKFYTDRYQIDIDNV